MITVSVPVVNDILRNYSDYKEQLKADAARIQELERYSPDDTLEDMLYPHNRLDGMRVRGGFMSDPTSRIALSYYDRFEQERSRHITPIVERHHDLDRLVRRITECVQELCPIERTIIQRIYLEKVPISVVGVRLRMTSSQLYRCKEAAVRRLTALVKAKYTAQAAS